MTADTYLEELTEFAQSARRMAPAELQTERLGYHVLDALGCAVRGVDEPPVHAAVRAAHGARPRVGGATALTLGAATPEQAAFVNGIAIRCLDFNDTLSAARTGGHPSDVLAAVLASCESESRSGTDLTKGLLAAYATFAALADQIPLRNLGFDQGLLVGLATVVGVSVATEMGATATQQALALTAMAALSPRVARSGQLSHWKGVATAYAAREALAMCLLARAGMTGPPQPFVGRHGVWEQLGAEPAGDLHPDLATIHRVGLKLLPVEWCAQAPVEILLEHRRKLAPGSIVRIEVEAYGFLVDEIGGGRGDREAKWNPTTRETADHSLPFLLAVALAHGEVSLRTYEDRLWEDPEVRSLMSRVTITEDPDLTRSYPASQAVKIRVISADNRVVKFEAREACGHPSRPATPEQVLAKFHDLAGGLLPTEHRQALIHASRNLPELRSVHAVLRPLRALDASPGSSQR